MCELASIVKCSVPGKQALAEFCRNKNHLSFNEFGLKWILKVNLCELIL